MEWVEFSIGYFRFAVGPVSAILVYRHGKGYRIAVQGFFYTVEHPKWVKGLDEAKEIALRLLVKALEDALAQSKGLVEKDLECATSPSGSGRR